MIVFEEFNNEILESIFAFILLISTTKLKMDEEGERERERNL